MLWCMVGRRDRRWLAGDAFPWRERRQRRTVAHRPMLRAELRERDGVKPLELFFDLVFVLAFTQCTALMAEEHSLAGIGRGVLVLGIVWWAWVSFAWLTSLVDPEEGSVRLVMFLVMVALLVVTLAIPEAFGDHALWFAVAFGFVRAGHVGLFLLATRDDPDLRRWVVGLSVVTAVVVVLLVAGALLEPEWRAVLWLSALVIDVGFPARYGVDRWRLVPGHFAERHNLVIILALGESVIAVGIGAHSELDAGVAVVGALAILLASALWWIYFDIVALATARRLERAPAGRQRNRLARDSYSYLHFPMVAGIVLAALGFEGTVLHGAEPFETVSAVALLGGVALYLLGHVALRLRNAGTVNAERLGVAVVLLALIPAATRVDAIWTLVAVNVLLWAMIAFETIWVYDDNRFLLRHDMDVRIPSRDDLPRRPGRSRRVAGGEPADAAAAPDDEP